MSRLKFISGSWHAVFMDEKVIRSAMEYEPQPNDVFICTYPKCGTNWMHTIVSLILNKGGPIQFRVGVADTFFEFVGREVIEEVPPPRLIPTHFKRTQIPFAPHAKYIYVIRNPKDACLSFYHQLTGAPHFGMVIESLDQFIDNYIRGYVPFGSYFEHLASWYESKDKPNVLFTSYEDMKADITGSIREVARFLGPEYADVVRDESVLESIAERCSMSSMYKELSESIKKVEDEYDEALGRTKAKKGLEALVEGCNLDTESGQKKKLFHPTSFVRKGIVGGWKDVLAEEQSRKIEEKFLEATKDLDVSRLWKSMDWIPRSSTEQEN